jgi:hypothetical protein
MDRAFEALAAINAFLVSNAIGVIILAVFASFIPRWFGRAFAGVFNPRARLLKDIGFVSGALREFETGTFIATCIGGVVAYLANTLLMILCVSLNILMETRTYTGLGSTIGSWARGVSLFVLLYAIFRIGFIGPGLIKFIETIRDTSTKLSHLHRLVLRLPLASRSIFAAKIAELEEKAHTLGLIP